MTAGTLVITGANGFVGTHLAEIASQQGVDVWAIGREPAPDLLLQENCAKYFSMDLEKEWKMPVGADAVVHLAGLSAVGPSFAHPQRYLTGNSAIMTTMCEGLLAHSERPRVVVVSSGAVYGAPEGGTPVAETSATAPSSPYAVAKLLVESQATYYGGRGLDTVIARPFNHIGPRQGTGFLVPDLTAALRDSRPGETLAVGDLGTARDYTDVRDVARAYLALAFAAEHHYDRYNVCSGEAHSGREVLAVLAEALDRPVPPTEMDPARLRPADPPVIVGAADRLRQEYGWEPKIPWQQSVRDFINAEVSAQ
ncbi:MULTISPECIES: NAD-dependent epimerase/dehydratase family protein [Microbacterium]|uniref:NAD-dependent epimerase/dehydratase family protein n=1 Tax=Microbacterium wangchenii TaxID=2541726 RepID=A0ABX5SNR0_9MICO|nr:MULTISPECIES: GDP-mannose 4,6-dehydratase [Microbacterium]MCK6068098.1 GDP-mannose 4,6-dehydratase [Microbacterium sp. EYE_512]QBR87779.1 NAD-dependent epimerase/dehydratase family protein [Microbacterium wangchenii]